MLDISIDKAMHRPETPTSVQASADSAASRNYMEDVPKFIQFLDPALDALACTGRPYLIDTHQ